MFKAQIIRRSFSLWPRVPRSQIIRSAMRDGHEVVHVQRVQFRKPFFSRSRLIGFAAVLGGLHGLSRWLDDQDDVEEVVVHRTPRPPRRQQGGTQGDQEEQEEVDEDEEEEDEEDEEVDEVLLFLPTGFAQPKPRKWYKGSDPEWQQFRQLGSDPKRLERIRNEFIGKVHSDVTNNRLLKRHLGNIDPAKGGRWVEFQYPDGPPIEFERPGFEITEDLEVRRSTRPVSHVHHQKLINTLIPTAAASAVYTDIRRRITIAWLKLKGSLNGNSTTSDNMNNFVTYLRPDSKPSTDVPTSPSPFFPPFQPRTTTDTSPSSQSTSTDSKNQSDASPLGNQSLQRFLPKLTPSLQMSLDAMSFRQNYSKNHRHVKMEPPRGSMVVSGLVEVCGDRGRITVDAKGFYDPKAGKFLVLQWRPRSFRPARQVPRGGN